ncbi:hypothetical protein Scep_030203 [Stephania cephalantha]|uniref:Uncharacterized protein n=1 Tax=Stephania cephalantha TaxID=152367 RepID=A0AAP0E3M3_9MAGN
MLGSMASACKHWAELRKERGGGERRAAAFTRAQQRRRRRRARSGGATRGVVGVGVRCRGRREAVKSRATTAMTVDDDDDGGGEDCATAVKGFGWFGQRRDEDDGFFDLTFLCCDEINDRLDSVPDL